MKKKGIQPIVKTLKNGVRVLMIPQPTAVTATVLILVGTGSKYETKQKNGVAHFLEHMCFKGTTRRPSTKIIAEAFETIGAVNNAFTTQEYTGYYAKGSPEQVPTFLDVLSDIYVHSTFPAEEMDKEKGVIIEEINMYEDHPQYKVGEIMMTLMYGDQAAGWPLAGTKETVLSLAREDLVQYHNKHYHSENTIIILSGAVDPKDMLKQVTACFGTLAPQKKAVKKRTIDTQDAFRMSVVAKQSDQTHLALGFRSLQFGHKDAPVTSLLATILGRGMSSRLFHTLREEMGVAYYAGTEQDALSDHGYFAITAGIDKTRFDEVVSAIAHELTRIKTELVTDAELTKAKQYTYGMMRLGLESSDDIASFYGRQLVIKGTFKTPEQTIREYQAVTPSDIRRLAKKLFVSKHANLAVVGPYNTDALDVSPLMCL